MEGRGEEGERREVVEEVKSKRRARDVRRRGLSLKGEVGGGGIPTTVTVTVEIIVGGRVETAERREVVAERAGNIWRERRDGQRREEGENVENSTIVSCTAIADAVSTARVIEGMSLGVGDFLELKEVR